MAPQLNAVGNGAPGVCGRRGFGDEAQSGPNRTSSPQSGSGAAVKRAASAVPGGQPEGPTFTAAERTLAVDRSSRQAPRPGIRASNRQAQQPSHPLHPSDLTPASVGRITRPTAPAPRTTKLPTQHFLRFFVHHPLTTIHRASAKRPNPSPGDAERHPRHPRDQAARKPRLKSPDVTARTRPKGDPSLPAPQPRRWREPPKDGLADRPPPPTRPSSPFGRREACAQPKAPLLGRVVPLSAGATPSARLGRAMSAGLTSFIRPPTLITILGVAVITILDVPEHADRKICVAHEKQVRTA